MPIEESRKAVQEKFNLPERFILFVGTIEPRKCLGSFAGICLFAPALQCQWLAGRG